VPAAGRNGLVDRSNVKAGSLATDLSFAALDDMQP
jgi:hypothetical protein